MARILLVRHGQSEWNAERRWQGQADIALSELGYKQAYAAAEVVGTFDLIASSPLIRAAETARILSDATGVGPVISVPELVERSAGEWSGLTRIEIERDWPGYLDDGNRPPNYETDEQLWPRVEAGLRAVAHLANEDGEALTLAHGGLIYMLEERANLERGSITNLGGVWLEVNRKGLVDVGERVSLIDDSLVSTQPSGIL